MAVNDIYDNEGRYEKFVANLDSLLNKPDPNNPNDRKRKYWIKNKANLKYFKQLFRLFASKDTSYIRRLRVLSKFMIVAHVLDMDLKDAERKDIDTLMAFAHKVNSKSKSKRDFVIDLKYIWRNLFPEKDSKGRPDETLTPYVVRHLSSKIDKSKETLRGDKLSVEEFEKLVHAFADDPRMQFLLTGALEALGRPQELLWRKIKNVEMHENFAKIYITDHGKEGCGFLQIVDSFFYLTKWLNVHPLKDDPEAYLFINIGRTNRHQQLKPPAVNKLIRDRCKRLGIKKPITFYSLKRNGVTMTRLSGKTDLQIQHTARWSSLKQLKTYDMSEQDESFRRELIQKGIVKPTTEEEKLLSPKTKNCQYCNATNGIAESYCENCKRPLDKKILDQQTKDYDSLKDDVATLKQQLKAFQDMLEVQRATKLKKHKWDS